MCSQNLDTSFLRIKFATIPLALAIFSKRAKSTLQFLLEPYEPKQAKDSGGGGGRARRAVFPGGQDPAPEEEQNRKPHKAQVQPGPNHSSQVLSSLLSYFLNLRFLEEHKKYEFSHRVHFVLCYVLAKMEISGELSSKKNITRRLSLKRTGSPDGWAFVDMYGYI